MVRALLLGKPKLPCCGAVAALISPAPRKCANLAQFLLRGSGGGSPSNLVALRDLRARKLRSLGGVHSLLRQPGRTQQSAEGCLIRPA
jgi:hypothetical protein